MGSADYLHVLLKFSKCSITSLLDSGASRSLLRRQEFDVICKQMGRHPILSKTVDLCAVTGHQLKVLGMTELYEEQLGSIPIIVVEGIQYPCILGRDVLKQHEAIINYQTGTLTCNNASFTLTPGPNLSQIQSFGPRPPTMNRDKIKQCVMEHEHLFAAKGEPLGCHPDIAVRIITEGPPIRRRPYRIPLKKRAALDEIIEDYLKQGVIVPSSSPWASPIVLVKKKDPSDGPRFCVDYTKLNAVTKKDSFPIPLIRDIFDQLQGAKIFSTLDLKSGFHQIPIDPRDQEKTAFISHKGLFEFTRLSMGLSNSSAAFQRAMEVVLKGLIGDIAMLYIDDIVIYSRSEADHINHLRLIFQRLNHYNLRLNPAKCVFGLTEVKLLGYIVSEQGLRADPDKVSAIARMAAPDNLAQVRTLLGMTGYYRSCIQDYAKIAAPLVALTKKNTRFQWAEAQQQAFDALKQALISEQVMAHPKTDQPYLLYTDACDYAIGAILCQLDDQGVERPVVYLSKQLSDTQKRWSCVEKEAFAVITSLKQFRPYLVGAQFRCFSDHKPLMSLFTKDMNNTKIQRWAALMAEYNCKVEYHKGKLNIRADMLSRIKQADDINTYDIGHWQLGDPLNNLPPDESAPDIYGLNLKQVAEAQRSMTEWSEHVNEDSHYIIVNGALYSTKRPYKYAPDYPRLVLPQQFRHSVMEQSHLDVGHMATIKTMRKLQDAFVWPGMKKDIMDFIAKCPLCIAHSKHTVRAPMGEMPIATAPMQMVAMDLVGPLPMSPAGNQYLLNLVDYCTGWGESYAIPSKASNEVWKKLTRDFFPRHSYPDIMVSDLGAEFNAQTLKDYLAQVGVEHRTTSAYNPASNGKVERFNRVFKALLRKLINNQRCTWEDQLGPALMAYNNSVSSVTGHTPYFLHYGRRARLPLTRLMHTDRPLDDRLNDVAHALQTAAQLTAESRHHNRERLAKQANCGEFKVGQSVVIRAPEPLSMTSQWDPQWEIISIKGKAVRIRHQPTGKIKTLNVNKLRVVDPNIAWDTVLKRPIRNPRLGPRRKQTAPWLHPAPPPLAHATPKTSTKPRSPTSAPHSRPDTQSGNTAHSRSPPLARKRPGTTLEQPHFQRPSQPAPREPAVKHQRTTQLTPLHLKRSRPFIPRATKRPAGAPPPDLQEQKRLRVETVNQVKLFLSTI